MMERMMERELALRVADQLRGARPAMVCNVGCRLIVAALIERVLGDQIRALTLDEIAEADRMLDKMMLMRRQLAEFPLAGGG